MKNLCVRLVYLQGLHIFNLIYKFQSGFVSKFNRYLQQWRQSAEAKMYLPCLYT